MYRGAWLVALGALASCDSVLHLDPIAPLPESSLSPRAVVFHNSTSTVDLVAFPALVPLDGSAIVYEEIADPAHDLRFVDEASNTEVPFEIEHWDTSGESLVWVRVPVIHAHSTTDRLLLYFGADAHGTESPAEVWSDYDAVFHGDALVDSTGRSQAVALPDETTQAMPQAVPGIIGNGLGLSGTGGQRVELQGNTSLLSNWQAFTIELWLAPAYAPDPYNLGSYADGSGVLHPLEPAVISKPGGAMSAGRLRNSQIFNASPLIMQTDFAWENASPLQGAIFYMPDAGTWSQVTFAYDGQVLWWYRNATALEVYANDTPRPTVVDTAGDNLTIGGGAPPMNGVIDEVRVSHLYHDADWVAAQYFSMTKHFVTIGSP